MSDSGRRAAVRHVSPAMSHRIANQLGPALYKISHFRTSGLRYLKHLATRSVVSIWTGPEKRVNNINHEAI